MIAGTGSHRAALAAALGFAVLGGCLDTDDGADDLVDDADTSTTEQDSFVLLGNIYQNGTLVSFDDITGVTGLIMSRVVGLTACDTKALYAVQKDPLAPPLIGYRYSLWFSNTSGQSWSAVGQNAKSAEIACDHARLATLDSSGRLWVAQTQPTGALAAWGDGSIWQQSSTPITVNRIQGGDGSIYGVKLGAGGNSVYRASGRSVNAELTWSGPIASVGAVQVTGTGATVTGTDNLAIGNSLAWSRRAFALETDGQVSTNSTLLAGVNWWTWMNTGSERYTTLSAATPAVLFAIQVRDGVTHLNRIRVDETSCADGVDNDSDGLRDGEDTDCRQAAAEAYCATAVNGTHCADRFQASTFLDQLNQNTALVTCSSHHATAITAGVCQRVSPGTDYLPSIDALTPADPPNTGRYCNVHYGDGTWDFAWTGSDPCAALLTAKPGAVIVRAGLYSTTGANNIHVKCSDGGLNPGGAAGVAPLQNAYNAVGHTANKCIFAVSIGALPLLDRFWAAAHEVHDRYTNPFVHNNTAIDLAQFGHGQTGTSLGVEREGYNFGAWESAYDSPLDESRPVLAAGYGVVVSNGAWARDVSGVGCVGSSNQGEVHVRYSIGSSARYRETFVVGYMHLRKWIVTPGQTVRPGQIVGYVGATGCTSGFGHIHTGVFRTSNINAHTVAAPDFGYHANFLVDSSYTGNNMGGGNAVDPLGWANYSAFDPWAYLYWNTGSSYASPSYTGVGAWSPALFKPGQEFTYPYVP